MNVITPSELHAELQSGMGKLLLLDVREPREFDHCRIEGSINLPMNSVPGRVAEIDPTRKIVTICHHGMRSASVADFLNRQGFPDVWNLVGGVAAWAEQVDPDMPRY
jgi:rhodanese-related sulfurtransferase